MRNDDSDLGKVPALAAADDFNPAGVEIRSGFGEFLEEAFANRIASRDGHRDTKDIALRRAEEADREQAYAGRVTRFRFMVTRSGGIYKGDKIH